MADPAIAGARRTYLVEHYLVGAGTEELTRSATRLRDTVAQMEREGTEIGYVSATVVPADDYFTSLLEAPTEHLAREALTRADVAFERISVRVTRSDDRESTHPRNSRGVDCGGLRRRTCLGLNGLLAAKEK